MVITILILAKSLSSNMDPAEIEKRAREMGMIYPEEYKVMDKGAGRR